MDPYCILRNSDVIAVVRVCCVCGVAGVTLLSSTGCAGLELVPGRLLGAGTAPGRPQRRSSGVPAH